MTSFLASNQNIEGTPKIIGHGHVLGENYNIDEDLSNITTAKNIFLHVDFKYNVKQKEE